MTPALVVTGVPWRTGWRYRERGYRHVYWDAGTMLAQLLAVADSAGLAARLYSRFPDAAVAALVGADGVHEWPVAVVALGDGAPALEATGASRCRATSTRPRWSSRSSRPRSGRGSSTRSGPPWDRGAPVDVPVAAARSGRGGRARARVAAPDGSHPRPAGEPAAHLAWTSRCGASTLPHFVVVHDVEGLRRVSTAGPTSRPRCAPAAMRDELYRVCLEQGLARDAAFVVIAATDVGALDDREYREAQLAAGLVEGRLHLLAYGLGASASGMTFLDSEVPALLGEPLDALLFTCVGVPEYASAVGGSPGAPTAVRKVTER